jgi:LysM repeat protein
MAGRSPARFLAPIALVAFAIALYSVVQGASQPAGDDSSARPAATATSTSSKKSGAKKSSKRKRKTYTVKAGDTASAIAEKTGISLETLLELNPNVDPQTLSPGQKLRLSK